MKPTNQRYSSEIPIGLLKLNETNQGYSSKTPTFTNVKSNQQIKGIRVKFQSLWRLEFCIENTEF